MRFGPTELLIILIFYVGPIALVAWDMQRRGRSGALWALAMFFFPLIALIVWLVVRGKYPVKDKA